MAGKPLLRFPHFRHPWRSAGKPLLRLSSEGGLFHRWLRAPHFRHPGRSDAGEVRLGSRQIYILPTRAGLLFGIVLIALLLAAVNYTNALAYLLTFLLASQAIVSILHTQRNLLHLRVIPGGGPPVFAGEAAQFRVCLHNDGVRGRRGVRVEASTVAATAVDIPERDVTCVTLSQPAAQRGWLLCPPFVLATHYPLGLLRAWSRRIQPDARTLVYPRPAEHAVLPLSAQTDVDGEHGTRIEGEDYTGLRAYQAGDSPARISWKTLARGQGLHTKDFSAAATESVWLEWGRFAPHDPETRLSLLCRALLEAESAGRAYGLRLPGFAAAPDRGAAHQHHCLEALALYEETARA
jgi:uncharacterized protein (DUF58 family)